LAITHSFNALFSLNEWILKPPRTTRFIQDPLTQAKNLFSSFIWAYLDTAAGFYLAAVELSNHWKVSLINRRGLNTHKALAAKAAILRCETRGQAEFY
jgi:hypothetical protein